MASNLRLLVAILACGAAASAQGLVEVSVKAGVPLTETFQTNSWGFLATGYYQGTSATRRYTLGAGISFRLPHRFGAEADILYRRLGFGTSISPSPYGDVLFIRTATTANSWEFPVMGTYRLSHSEKWIPRVAAGVSFRTVSGIGNSGQCSSQVTALCNAAGPDVTESQGILDARSHVGGVASAGVETHIGRVRILPEIRYTRWRADGPEPEAPFFTIRSNPNQLDLLLSLGF